MNIETIEIVKALVGDDMRATDLRVATKYYQRGIEYLSKGDEKGAKICARSMDELVNEWPSLRLMQEDLINRVKARNFDKLIIREAV